ncbi:unnamed protein product, partial [Rotaria sp. Silwood2]
MSRGIINVIDNILWPPERRDQIQFKTAYDALEDAQFSRLRQLADRSDYFRSELRSMHHQTWFLPNDQAFASLGANAQFLFEQSLMNNTNDINDFIKSHIVPIVLYPSVMDASKQLSTLNRGKWVTFRKLTQTDQTFQIDVISNRQVARILSSRTEDIKIYGNGVVYPIPTFLSGIARSAADELARSYQYFMALVQQSGDTELVNLLQGNTAGLGNTGPNALNPENLLTITVLIPQQISVQQLGNSQDLSMNLRRHILRFPVYTDQLSTMSNPFSQQQSFMVPQQPFIPPGYPAPQFQRAASSSNKKQPQRHRRRRRQLNMPSNINFQQQQNFPIQQQQPQTFPGQQQQQNLPIQQQQTFSRQQQKQMLPVEQQTFPMQQQQQNFPRQQQQQNFPIQQQQTLPNQQQTFPMQQPQQNLPIQQQQQTFPRQQQQQNLPIQQQPMLPVQQQQQNLGIQQQQTFSRQQQMLPTEQQTFSMQQPQQNLPIQQQQQTFPRQQQQQNLPIQQQPMLPVQQQQQNLGIQQQQTLSRQQQMLPTEQQTFSMQQPQQNLPIQQQQQTFPRQQQQQNLPIQQQQMLPTQQQQMMPTQQLLPTQKQQMSSKQQMLPEQPMFPNQQFLPDQQQQMLPSQPLFPNQQLLPNQQQLNPALNPNYYQMPLYPTSTVFQDGQIYPTMDPQFSIQAQISSGPNGNVVTLVGRPENSLPFTAAILNTESNIPIKNGVMHVIRGILSGMVIPLDTVLSTMQGASSFTQLLQQTGVLDQLKQSGRPYTLFIPTNAALQSIGVTTNTNQIRQFVLRHVCADVLLDPMANILRRSGGYYSRGQMPRAQQRQQPQPQQQQRRTRRKRQDWADTWRNGTMTVGRQPMKASDLGPGYFQPQEQVYGGYPAAPSPFGSYNQLYNPAYVMSGYANPNSEYYPYSNGSNAGAEHFYYQSVGVPFGKPMSDAAWNSTFGAFYNPQMNVVPMTGGSGSDPSYYTGTGGFYSGSSYVAGPQSCMAMTGERITVQPLAGTQLA